MDGPRVGFVGAGSMGAPMVERLAAAGIPVTVYARRPEVRAHFVGLGIRAVDSLAAVAEGADVVIACVYSDAQVREVAEGPDGLVAAMAPGSVLAIHTTGSPATARALAEQGSARGVRVVDAPVSGGVDDIMAGRLTVMLGGDPADTARVREVVAAYADAVFDTGAVGSAQAVKLINNSLFAANLQLVAEAERMGRAFGADPVALSRIVQRSSGASYVMGLLEAMGGTEALVAAAGHYMRKDVDVVNQVAAEVGVDLGLLGRVANADAVTFEARVE